MYLKHFNLKEKPFQLNTDPRFFWTGNQQKKVLSTLAAALLDAEDVLLLSTDFGIGKTTLLNAVIPAVQKNRVVVRLPYADIGIQAFFRSLAAGFQWDDSVDNVNAFVEAVDRFGEKLRENNHQALLVLDEAQSMPSEILKVIQRIAARKRQRAIPLNILLAGQCDVELLQTPFNRGLLRRKACRVIRLDPLTARDTEAYIQHRLRIAGATRNLFTRSAVADIFLYSSGIPRDINTLCDFSLFHGYQKGVDLIDHQVVKNCAERFQIKSLGYTIPAAVKTHGLQPQPPRGNRPQNRPFWLRSELPVTAGALVMVCGILFFMAGGDGRFLDSVVVAKDRLGLAWSQLFRREARVYHPPSEVSKKSAVDTTIASPGFQGRVREETELEQPIWSETERRATPASGGIEPDAPDSGAVSVASPNLSQAEPPSEGLKSDQMLPQENVSPAPMEPSTTLAVEATSVSLTSAMETEPVSVSEPDAPDGGPISAGDTHPPIEVAASPSPILEIQSQAPGAAPETLDPIQTPIEPVSADSTPNDPPNNPEPDRLPSIEPAAIPISPSLDASDPGAIIDWLIKEKQQSPE